MALVNIVIVMLMLILDRMFKSEGSLKRRFHEISRAARLADLTWKRLMGALYRIETPCCAIERPVMLWLSLVSVPSKGLRNGKLPCTPTLSHVREHHNLSRGANYWRALCM